MLGLIKIIFDQNGDIGSVANGTVLACFKLFGRDVVTVFAHQDHSQFESM